MADPHLGRDRRAGGAGRKRAHRGRLYCDLGILAAGGVTVPIYPSLGRKVAAYFAVGSKARFAIAGSDELTARVAMHPYPSRIFTIDEEVAAWTRTEPSDSARAQVAARLAALDPEHVATVVYTSGTTGDPKANEFDADVVLVGRRGRGGVAELLLGSVSHELVLHCKRPVLVISSL